MFPAILLMIVPIITHAENRIHTPTKHSLQVAMDDLLKFSSLYGGVISYKLHFHTRSALRLGILLGGKIEEGTDTVVDENSVAFLESNLKKMASIGMHTHLIKYRNPEKKIKFYHGAGPCIRYTYHYHWERDNIADYTQIEKSKDYTFALDGLVGLEWIFTESVGFILEYPVNVSYYMKKTKKSKLYEDMPNKIQE